MIKLLAARRDPLQQLDGAVDGNVFLVAGDQKRDRAFWFAAVVGAVAALIVLALFRYIERQLPSEFYAHHMLRFARDHVIGEEETRKLIHDHGLNLG